jgi:hypothetical protein
LATWWEGVALAAALHGAWPDGSSLPNGAVVHYDPYQFLPWLNTRTWTSEWPKYRANNLANPGCGAADADPPILSSHAREALPEAEGRPTRA